MDMEIFERLESEVRGYCRAFPTVFAHARGAQLTDEEGRRYVDFFSGAGALNYGHNDPGMKAALVRYLLDDGIVHSLDMATTAKAEFLETFESLVLVPRGLDYCVQFPGPTGTNAVEAALKLARKVTGRETVVSFTNAFHGMTLGSLAITGNGFKRRGAGVPLTLGDTMPFDGYLGEDVDTLDYLEALVTDEGSGVDKPAAVVLETVQAEGGINVASTDWLRRIERICRSHGILLIVDDIQVGCGRTGPFFSFERAGIVPDLVCLSKSLSGFGLPMAILLIRPDLDVWEPGEHNGTFRGHNPAFVTARTALEEYWADDSLSRQVAATAGAVRARLDAIVETAPHLEAEVRGVGLIQGIACADPGVAAGICQGSFERGLIMETAGPDGNVVKVMPPLTIDEVTLKEGLEILETAVHAATPSVEDSTATTGSDR
jgi:diaminobutyrate-2-oxoglutarate transaminase